MSMSSDERYRVLKVGLSPWMLTPAFGMSEVTRHTATSLSAAYSLTIYIVEASRAETPGYIYVCLRVSGQIHGWYRRSYLRQTMICLELSYPGFHRSRVGLPLRCLPGSSMPNLSAAFNVHVFPVQSTLLGR